MNAVLSNYIFRRYVLLTSSFHFRSFWLFVSLGVSPPIGLFALAESTLLDLSIEFIQQSGKTTRALDRPFLVSKKGQSPSKKSLMYAKKRGFVNLKLLKHSNGLWSPSLPMDYSGWELWLNRHCWIDDPYVCLLPSFEGGDWQSDEHNYLALLYWSRPALAIIARTGLDENGDYFLC